MNCSPLGQWIINNTSFIVSMIYDLLKYFVCFPLFGARMLMSHRSSAIKLVKIKKFEMRFEHRVERRKMNWKEREKKWKSDRENREMRPWMTTMIAFKADNRWIAEHLWIVEKKPTNLCKWNHSLAPAIYLSLLPVGFICFISLFLASFASHIFIDATIKCDICEKMHQG